VERILSQTGTGDKDLETALKKKEVLREAGDAGAVTALVKKGVLEQFEKEELWKGEPEEDYSGEANLLNDEQQTSLNEIKEQFLSHQAVLLVILTRSGGLTADWKGILLMFVAVFSAVAYTMVVKVLAEDYTPITITAYQSFFGLLMFVPLFLIFEVPHLDFTQWTTNSLLAVVFLGVFGSGICFILITIGIRELGAARANIFGNLIPVVTAIVSFFVLKESMPLMKILGIIIVILGLLLSQISSLRVKPRWGREAVRHIPNA